LRLGAEGLREQNALIFNGLLKIAVSEGESLAGDLDRALATLDDGLATSDRTGHRAFDAELHTSALTSSVSASAVSSACASAISGISGVGAKPSSAGASTRRSDID